MRLPEVPKDECNRSPLPRRIGAQAPRTEPFSFRRVATFLSFFRRPGFRQRSRDICRALQFARNGTASGQANGRALERIQPRMSSAGKRAQLRIHQVLRSIIKTISTASDQPLSPMQQRFKGSPRIWFRAAFCNLALLLSCLVAQLHAQGRIDPSLPPQPITFTRTLLLFPGVDTVKDPHAVLPPLTTKQKFWLFRRRTVDYSLPIEALMFGGGSHAINYSPHYGSGPAAFGERVASYSGSIASSSFFTDALLPSAFHQDPRYFRKGRGSVASRIWYAFESEAVTRSDSGNLTFNSSGLLGFGISTALSNAWYPRSSITFSSTMQRYGIKLGISALLNVMREFGGTRDEEQPVHIGPDE